MDSAASHSQMERPMKDFTKTIRSMVTEYLTGSALQQRGDMKDGGVKGNKTDMDL